MSGVGCRELANCWLLLPVPGCRVSVLGFWLSLSAVARFSIVGAQLTSHFTINDDGHL